VPDSRVPPRVQPAPRLLDRVRAAIGAKHYSPHTETAYLTWIRRFIFFHGRRHPETLGADEVNAFLALLATGRHVSASTQNQASSALLFLYASVLNRPLDGLSHVVTAKRPVRLPVNRSTLIGCEASRASRIVVTNCQSCDNRLGEPDGPAKWSLSVLLLRK
jgi:hypothetical protein